MGHSWPEPTDREAPTRFSSSRSDGIARRQKSRQRPVGTEVLPGPAKPLKMIALKGDCPNFPSGNGLRPGSRPVAHTLPTFSTADPDLAFIVGVWDRLTAECKRRLIEIVRL